jgi:Tol biopolymer transport system component
MALPAGARIGPYEVVAAVGAGGMGEVYRARDTQLHRDVAIKILPDAFSADGDRIARFQREAQVLASLNHPHIGAIYGLEHGSAEAGHHRLTALVLELVEGPTLADRIAQGPIPVDEALRIAKQIAQALEAAHERGVVHRDLKPSNIKLRADGTVKVLDFGLAKPSGPASGISDLSVSPTITSPAMTQMGIVMGTAAYMSPEQAKGKVVDARADVWAFGCVLYEMLTGRRVFAGDDVTDTLAFIITREPDWSVLPAETPPAVRRLLRRCLEKDSSRRLAHLADARLEIDEALAPPAHADALPAAAMAERRDGGLAWSIAAAFAIAFAAALVPAVRYLRSTAPSPPVLHFEVPVQPMRNPYDLTISPDGKRLAYAGGEGGQRSIWIRELGSLESKKLPGTEMANGAAFPLWSPDSRSIVFAVGTTLKKIDSAGGAAQTMANLGGQFGGGAWNREGLLLVASNGHGLRALPPGGGDLKEVTTRDTKLDETYHDCPSFLPDGRHFIYVAWSGKPENRAVYAGSLDSADRKRLMSAESNAAYVAPGYILFLRGRTLMARPFDANRLEFTGEPSAIVDDVAADQSGEVAGFSVSPSGVIVYRKIAAGAGTQQLMWVDRSGKSTKITDTTFQSPGVRLSPDGHRVLMTEGIPPDIWIYDLTRDLRVRLTTNPAVDHSPVWSPDGSRILFDSHRVSNSPGDSSSEATIFEMPASGATPETILLPSAPQFAQSPKDWSRDGRYVVFTKLNTGATDSGWNLWVLPLFGDRKPFPYRVTKSNENEASLSPNGRWLAFTTNESGRNEVVVQPFPDPTGGRWQISSEGGGHARWRQDGRELYYLDLKGRIIAASVTTDSTFEVRQSTPLFQSPVRPFPVVQSGSLAPYDVTADGTRFLISAPIAPINSEPIGVIVNWTGMLKH